MKNCLQIMKSEHGFVLPYVLFIASIVFIVITANIKMYQNDQQVTEQHIEQLKIETIIQMGRQKIIKDLKNNINLKSADYKAPDGEIKIIITGNKAKKYNLHMTIVTNNESNYTIRNQVTLD